MSQQRITARGVLTHEGAIFTAKRAENKRYFPGMYEIPGGWVEFGEHPEATVIREFKEEIGLDVEINGFIQVDSRILEGDHLVNLYFFVRRQDSSQQPQLQDGEHSEGRWLDQESFLKEYDASHPNYPAIKRAFEILEQNLLGTALLTP